MSVFAKPLPRLVSLYVVALLVLAFLWIDRTHPFPVRVIRNAPLLALNK